MPLLESAGKLESAYTKSFIQTFDENSSHWTPYACQWTPLVEKRNMAWAIDTGGGMVGVEWCLLVACEWAMDVDNGKGSLRRKGQPNGFGRFAKSRQFGDTTHHANVYRELCVGVIVITFARDVPPFHGRSPGNMMRPSAAAELQAMITSRGDLVW